MAEVYNRLSNQEVAALNYLEYGPGCWVEVSLDEMCAAKHSGDDEDDDEDADPSEIGRDLAEVFSYALPPPRPPEVPRCARCGLDPVTRCKRKPVVVAGQEWFKLCNRCYHSAKVHGHFPTPQQAQSTPARRGYVQDISTDEYLDC